MRISHLSLSDFRNYRVAEVDFQAGHNLIVGRNGQGKTNLVEAIAYFANLSSHRVTQDSAMIRAEINSAVARMRVVAHEREVLLEIQLNRDRANRAQINRNVAKPREAARWFSCVLFAPEDLLLVRGEPSVRRRFIDEALIAQQPAFAATLADYDRVVRQRTALLKSARASNSSRAIEATLVIWDRQLIELGSTIMAARRSLIKAMQEPLAASYESIVESDHRPSMALSESVETAITSSTVSRETISEAEPTVVVSRETIENRFQRALETVHRQELDRGMTLVGPHRDDLFLELNGLPVKGYASHGESWSYALALKLSLAQLLRQDSPSGDPVIILDDVFAELDVRRRNALMQEVSRFEQVIVTAAVEADVPPGAWNTIEIEAGAVVQGRQM